MSSTNAKVQSNQPSDFRNSAAIQLFFVGTYSGEGPYVRAAHGQGIISCNLHTQTGKIETLSVCNEISNASYLGKSAENNWLFAVDDRFDEIGSVKAFFYDEEDKVQLLSSQSSQGTSTCHLTCDSEGRNVFAVSYLNGVLTRHRFHEESFVAEPDCIRYEGSGPNSERQQEAHAHQANIAPGGKWLYVCDLGSDKLWIHEIKDDGPLQIKKSIDLPPGYGPRHLVWHPEKRKVYVFCELNAHVLTYDWEEQTGNLVLHGDHNSLPGKYNGMPAGAAIRMHPSSKALYVSNRNHDSLTMFSIDEQGELTFETWFSTKGKTPRDFGIDPTGQWLLAANQDSDTIIPFQLDPNTGRPTGKSASAFKCGTPVCILF